MSLNSASFDLTHMSGAGLYNLITRFEKETTIVFDLNHL